MDIVASLVAAAFGIVCFTQVIRSLRSGVLKGRVAPIHRARQPIGFFVGILGSCSQRAYFVRSRFYIWISITRLSGDICRLSVFRALTESRWERGIDLIDETGAENHAANHRKTESSLL